ncbi:SpaA isopeptide-forming pilin-related protein [Rathayibacter sp. YIM 133350]|uniref:SpaA isopeptide-forming pilin-related protein n=1 Tax=Rathayibacter sp. YIM 133350 TaxID=3131992 RepID=UPI00307FC77B
MKSDARWRRIGLIGGVVGLVLAVLGAGVATADPRGVPTNSNKGSLYGMPQPDGTVAGKNGDMFRVTWTDDGGATTSTLSYCVEAAIPIAILEPYQTASWSDASRNEFNANAAEVQWILQNAYPAFTGAQLSATTGITGITDQDAITATQFAIWNLTDPALAGGRLFPSPTTVPQDVATYPRSTVIQQLMVWLLDHAEATGTEPVSVLDITPDDPTAPAGTLAGPFVVETTSPTGATVTVDAGAVVDDDGDPITGPIGDDDSFWIDARSLPPGTNVTISATVQNAPILPGTIITSATPDVRTQDIIVASMATFATVRATAELTITEQQLGSISVHKVDAANASIPLAGAQFTVFTGAGDTVGTMTTDSAGNASIDGLPVGDYSVVETVAPTGYQLDDSPHLATVSSDVPVVLTITNRASTTGSGGGGGGLAKTGSDNTQASVLAVLAVIVGVGALVTRRRRREARLF